MQPKPKPRGQGGMAVVKKLVALFVVVLALTALTDAAIAQQQTPTVAQSGAPADAVNTATTPVKVSLPEATTLDQFKPLLGKWKWDTNPKLVSTFEIKSFPQDGKVSDLNYVVRGKSKPEVVANVQVEDGKLKIEIPLGDGTWKLTYYPNLGGMLDGSIYVSGGIGTIYGKFYREK